MVLLMRASGRIVSRIVMPAGLIPFLNQALTLSPSSLAPRCTYLYYLVACSSASRDHLDLDKGITGPGPGHLFGFLPGKCAPLRAVCAATALYWPDGRGSQPAE